MNVITALPKKRMRLPRSLATANPSLISPESLMLAFRERQEVAECYHGFAEEENATPPELSGAP